MSSHHLAHPDFRSGAYKAALLKDLEGSSVKLAKSKEAAVKELAAGTDLRKGYQVPCQVAS